MIEALIGISFLIFFGLLLFIVISLLPVIKIYIEKKANQRPLIKNEYKMMGYPNFGNQAPQSNSAPDVKVYVNLDDSRGQREDSQVKQIQMDEDAEEKAMKQLEDRKASFIPYSERKDVLVDFNDFGKEHVVKEN